MYLLGGLFDCCRFHCPNFGSFYCTLCNSSIWWNHHNQWDDRICQKRSQFLQQRVGRQSRNLQHKFDLVGSKQISLAIFVFWRWLGMGLFLNLVGWLLSLQWYHQPKRSEWCTFLLRLLQRILRLFCHSPKIVFGRQLFLHQVSFPDILSFVNPFVEPIYY